MCELVCSSRRHMNGLCDLSWDTSFSSEKKLRHFLTKRNVWVDISSLQATAFSFLLPLSMDKLNQYINHILGQTFHDFSTHFLTSSAFYELNHFLRFQFPVISISPGIYVKSLNLFSYANCRGSNTAFQQTPDNYSLYFSLTHPNIVMQIVHYLDWSPFQGQQARHYLEVKYS